MKEIQNLIDLKIDYNGDFEIIKNRYLNFREYLENLYQDWFPKCKKYSDIDITNQITTKHIEKKDYRMYIKYQFNVILKSSERIYNNIEIFYKETPEYLSKEIELLSEYGIDSIIFISWAFKIIKNIDLKIEINKSFALEPNKIIAASRLLLRNHIDSNHPGAIATRYTSCFLIRQSIEVFIKNLFGISFITNIKGEIQRLQPENLFELIDDSKINNKFPLPKSVVKKIHAWTQTFIHGGFLPYIWEIEWIQCIIEPLFEFKNIQLNKDFVNSLPEKIKRIYNQDDLIIYGENIWKYGLIEK